jgi:hypothetical protein
MSDDEQVEYERMLRAFLYGVDDGRPIRGRFVVGQGQRPPAEPPMVSVGRVTSTTEPSLEPTLADLAAVEMRDRAAEQRMRMAARQFRRHGGGIDFR